MQKRPDEDTAANTQLISCFQRGGQIHQPLYQYPEGRHGGNYAPDQLFPAWWADPSAPVSVSRRKTWRQLLTWSAVSSVVGRSISRCISIPEEDMATTTHLISCFRRGGQIYQPLYQYPRGTHGGNWYRYAPDQLFPAWWADPSAAVSVSPRNTWRQLRTWSAVSSVVGRSISRCICIPSPGPMWLIWLKLEGADIILDRRSGFLQTGTVSMNKLNNKYKFKFTQKKFRDFNVTSVVDPE